MEYKGISRSFFILITVLMLITGCNVNLSGPTPIPRGNCPVQPEAIPRVPTFSDEQSKYVFVLVDKSYQYTNDVLKYLSQDILPKIYAGDRITAAFMDLNATTDSIFLNRRSELLDPPILPSLPIQPPVTPTYEVDPDSPTTTKGEILIENTKVVEANNVILSGFYCEIGKWNLEVDRLKQVWELEQKNETEQFLINARADIRLLTTNEFERGKLLYDSVYLANQMIDRAKNNQEFTDYVLIIFSDMREWRPEQSLNINLSDVNVAVGIHNCEFAIDCEVITRWEAEFANFGAIKPHFFVQEDNIYRSINKFIEELP